MATNLPQHDVNNAGLPEIASGATIANAMADLARGPIEAVDVRILLCHALCLNRIQLITQSERRMTTGEAAAINALLRRRLGGEPIAYIVGVRQFYGLPLLVTPDVLIPRPETELLVDLALAHLPAQHMPARVLDLGTGSGAIAVALAHTRPELLVTAVDTSTAALAVASANANRHAKGRPITLLQGDWYAALGQEQNNPCPPQQGFHLIVANPPYIASGDPHLAMGDLRFEPPGALTDGHDGLSALHTIVAGAPFHLEAGGWLLVEHGYDQAEPVRTLLAKNGFTGVGSWRDLANIERVTGGRWPTHI